MYNRWRASGSALRSDRRFSAHTSPARQCVRLSATCALLQAELHAKTSEPSRINKKFNLWFYEYKQISERIFVSLLVFQWRGLREALPPNVNLLSLESWSNGSLLVRLEHLFHPFEDEELSRNVTVNLKVFSSKPNILIPHHYQQ